MKKLTMLLCALGIVVLSAGLVACGDDDDEDDSAATEAATTTEAASAEVVNVEAGEYFFELSATPTADTKEITFQNNGAEEHDLILAKINEGYTLDEAFEAEGGKGTAEEIGFSFAKPGDEGKPIEIKQPLEPGNYGMVCTVETPDGELHYDLGMQEEFSIE